MAFKGFRSRALLAQAHDAGVFTVMDFAEESFDPDAAFASPSFTVPAGYNGLYGIFEAGLRDQSVSDSVITIQVSTDGGSIWTDLGGHFVGPDGLTTGLTVSSGVVLLSTGNIYRVLMRLNVTGSTAADQRNFFSLTVLNEPFSGFRAEATTTQALAANTPATLVVGSEVFDTDNGLASSTFTVPASWDGRWARFDAGASIDPDTVPLELVIQRSTNGGGAWASLAAAGQDAGVYPNEQCVSTVRRVNTGDQIRVLVTCTMIATVVDVRRTFFSGHLLVGTS